MKLFLTIIIISLTNTLFSQKNNELKYSIGIKTFTPIYLTGSDKFYNDNWIIFEPQERTYFKYAFGLDFRYYFSSNVSAKLWGGISKRTLSEFSYDEFYNNCMGCGGELEKNSEEFKYNQTSYNFSIGINFSENINKFQLNTGIELSYLHTGKGNQDYIFWWMEYEDVNLPDSNYAYSKTTISSGNSYGIGLYIGLEYSISKHISIGTEFHQFMYYSIFKGTSTNEWTDYRRNLGTTTTFSEGESETKDNFKQIAFSTILPVLDIRYKF